MILLAALLLDAALGEPAWLWRHLTHPAVLMGNIIGWADRRFNSGTDAKLRGTLVIAALVTAALLMGRVIAHLPFGAVWQTLLVAILLAQRSLADHVTDVARALRQGLPDARQSVARIVGRDVETLDAAGVARGAIESGAENLSDGVIAPVFWFAILGLPGIFAYKIVNTADSMIGYRTPRHAAFGWASARLDDVLNWAPARLTAALILLSHGKPALWRDVARDAVHHRSPNAGWPEAAMALVLGVSLSGPRSYDGRMGDQPYVNAAGHAPHAADIDRSVGVLWRVWAMIVGGMAIWLAVRGI